MKFLWVSDLADTLALAMRLQREGNEVEFSILDKSRGVCGDGMINKVKDWRACLAKDKIIVFDMVGSGKEADKLRKQGYMVFGASALADKMELDRPFGANAMKVAGIPTPPTWVFTDFDDALRFMETKRGKYVFKPSGNMNTAYTYVAHNDDDMIHFLENCKNDSAMKKAVEFELQEHVEGVEMSLEGMFNGKEWVDGWWNITFERKREFTGDLGHNTGCSLDIVKVLPEQIESPLVKKTLLKITPMLQAAGYIGPVDINCIWKNGYPMGLEWTTRFGINAIYTMMELVKDDLGKIIADTTFGSNRPVRTEKGQFGASVRCTLPSKPVIPHRLLQNINNFKHIHPLDVMLNGNMQLVSADTDFILAIVTAYGATIRKASDFVYHLIDKTEKFGILDLQYRTDCGEQATEMYERMVSWQLIKEDFVTPLQKPIPPVVIPDSDGAAIGAFEGDKISGEPFGGAFNDAPAK